MVLMILAAIWAAVLLPPWLQNRRMASPASSVVDFRHQLAVLQRTGQPSYAGARRPSAGISRLSRGDAARRRRDVFMTLLAGAGVTLLLAVALGGPVWVLHLMVDALLLGYTALLIQRQQRRLEVQAKVRYLPARQQPASQQLLLRRAGSR